MNKPMPDEFFRHLSAEEVEQFKAWARRYYTPGSEIKGIWHPVVRAECEAINREQEGK